MSNRNALFLVLLMRMKNYDILVNCKIEGVENIKDIIEIKTNQQNVYV